MRRPARTEGSQYDWSAKRQLSLAAGEVCLQPSEEGFSEGRDEHQGILAFGAYADLRQEALNILGLWSLHSGRETPLSISSKAAQAVLNQF